MRSSKRVMLLCALVMASIWGSTNTLAQDADNSIVAVVYDGTAESDCQQAFQEQDGPLQELSCPAGSVIFAVRMSEQEAIDSGYSDYLVLSGDEDVDSALIIDAAIGLHNSLAGSATILTASAARAFVPGAATCTATPVTLSGSYVNPRSGGRTYYQVPYYRNSNCSVSSARDRTRTTATASIRWDVSCVDSGYSCLSRNITLSGSWTGLKTLLNSWVGNYYGNYSTCTSGCGISNGVLALGFQTFV